MFCQISKKISGDTNKMLVVDCTCTVYQKPHIFGDVPTNFGGRHCIPGVIQNIWRETLRCGSPRCSHFQVNRYRGRLSGLRQKALPRFRSRRVCSGVFVLRWLVGSLRSLCFLKCSVPVRNFAHNFVHNFVLCTLISLSTWAALLTPLVTLILTFFDESALHHR